MMATFKINVLMLITIELMTLGHVLVVLESLNHRNYFSKWYNPEITSIYELISQTLINSQIKENCNFQKSKAKPKKEEKKKATPKPSKSTPKPKKNPPKKNEKGGKKKVEEKKPKPAPKAKKKRVISESEVCVPA